MFFSTSYCSTCYKFKSYFLNYLLQKLFLFIPTNNSYSFLSSLKFINVRTKHLILFLCFSYCLFNPKRSWKDVLQFLHFKKPCNHSFLLSGCKHSFIHWPSLSLTPCWPMSQPRKSNTISDDKFFRMNIEDHIGRPSQPPRAN